MCGRQELPSYEDLPRGRIGLRPSYQGFTGIAHRLGSARAPLGALGLALLAAALASAATTARYPAQSIKACYAGSDCIRTKALRRVSALRSSACRSLGDNCGSSVRTTPARPTTLGSDRVAPYAGT